ncbi:MAG: hypothetical protein H7Y03_06820 [Chitinophagaceae bacterium]|nr:hypothetical protein [Chitinophagaceae bacterium]
MATAKKAPAKKSTSKAASKKVAPKKAASKKAASKKQAPAKKAAPKKGTAAKNKLGVKNSLVNNINARKKKGISKPKEKSSINKKNYNDMADNWGKED